MTGIKRSLFGTALLGVIAILCLGYALFVTGDLMRQYTGISVRLTGAPVTQKTLENALEKTNERELSFTAAWTRSADERMAESELGGKTSLRVVCVNGDMRQVAPMKLYSGAYPTEDDTEGCLLDAASAWVLFHSTDAIGATVALGKQAYVVRGIAEMYEPAMMIRDDRAAYENLEFSSQNPDGAKQSVETFLYRCGSTDGSVIVQSGLIVRVIRGAAWLPMWIAMACFAVALFRRGWKMRKRLSRRALYWIVGAALCALLCWGAALTLFWPQSFLPTRWSDFAFWGQLIDNWRTEAKACALMTQLPKEIELFSAVRRCAVALLVSLLSGGWCVSAVRLSDWKAVTEQKARAPRTLESLSQGSRRAEEKVNSSETLS
jgi:hypothetical protein